VGPLPATTTLVPIVVRFHWDDLTHEFALVLSFELQTPLGNFRHEEKFTLGDLAAVIATIYNVFVGISVAPAGTLAGFNVGDFDAVGTMFSTAENPTTTLPDPPDPYDSSADAPPDFVEWHGTSGLPEGFTDWGVPE